jgi:hypothetical protein
MPTVGGSSTLRGWPGPCWSSLEPARRPGQRMPKPPAGAGIHDHGAIGPLNLAADLAPGTRRAGWRLAFDVAQGALDTARHVLPPGEPARWVAARARPPRPDREALDQCAGDAPHSASPDSARAQPAPRTRPDSPRRDSRGRPGCESPGDGLISVHQRTREIGVLHCIGARTCDIRRIFTAEGIVVPLAGWLLGIQIGYAIARASTG